MMWYVITLSVSCCVIVDTHHVVEGFVVFHKLNIMCFLILDFFVICVQWSRIGSVSCLAIFQAAIAFPIWLAFALLGNHPVFLSAKTTAHKTLLLVWIGILWLQFPEFFQSLTYFCIDCRIFCHQLLIRVEFFVGWIVSCVFIFVPHIAVPRIFWRLKVYQFGLTCGNTDLPILGC